MLWWLPICQGLQYVAAAVIIVILKGRLIFVIWLSVLNKEPLVAGHLYSNLLPHSNEHKTFIML